MTLKRPYQFANRHAYKLLLGGLLWIGWRNWRLWQQDKGLLLQKQEIQSLPPLKLWPDLPVASVLVAAWNEEKHLSAFIQSYCELNYPHKELLLCVGGTDMGYQIALQSASSHITIIEQRAGEGKYGALKRALPHAHGEIIYLTDADCRLNSGSFNRLIYPIIAENEQIATGHFRPLSSQLKEPLVLAQWSSYRRFQIIEASSNSKYTRHITGANCALNRSLFEEFSEKQDSIQIGGDLCMALYAQCKGHQIVRVFESCVESEFPTSIGSYVRQQCRWNKSRLLWHAHFGDAKTVRASTIMALKRQILLVLPALALVSGKVGAVGWILAWAYGFSPYWQSHMSIYRAKTEPQSNLCYKFVLMLAAYYAWAITPFELGISKLKNRW